MPRKHHPLEYRQRLIELVRSGRQLSDVSREFKVPLSTVSRWVNQTSVDRGEREGLTTDEKAELAKLRREVAELREEKEILKNSVEMAVGQRNPANVIHHSDQGCQYTSIAFRAALP